MKPIDTRAPADTGTSFDTMFSKASVAEVTALLSAGLVLANVVSAVCAAGLS